VGPALALLVFLTPARGRQFAESPAFTLPGGWQCETGAGYVLCTNEGTGAVRGLALCPVYPPGRLRPFGGHVAASGCRTLRLCGQIDRSSGCRP
jgi:hypothetical protein